ncbi:hypothetical protein [Wolbachia endosymbiont (group B) of Cyclophora punctaria]|uniref:hypothetical protein n=1 Tax=Wolbachia endosymbiont (group B) of Cyclophora punctaria TaxID=3066168 RepID=UPI003340112A
MNYMRTMKVFAVLVALASTASNGTSELEDQYKDRYEDQYKDQYEDQHKDLTLPRKSRQKVKTFLK